MARQECDYYGEQQKDTFNVSAVSAYASISTGWSGQSYRVTDKATGKKYVHLNVAISFSTAPSGATFATIPSGFRPKYAQAIPTRPDWGMILDTNGNIHGYASEKTMQAINIWYECS